MGRVKQVGAGAIIAAGFAGMNALKRKVTYSAPPAFYDPPNPPGSGELGEIVRVEEIPWIMRTPGWRILYRSTDHRGNPTIVSGLLIAPAGPAPEDGWPVVAVAHGTTGLNRGAAPSLAIDANSDETAFFYAKNMKPFLDAGYAVAFSDYEGLGATGRDSYLIGATEAANVLDSVRAIRRFSGIPVSDRLLVWGHSQGGHAAAFAVEDAKRYAPELSIAGAVLVAPAGELRQIIDLILEQNCRSYLSLLVMLSVASWVNAYPELREDDALKTPGKFLLRPTTRQLRMEPGALCCRPFTPERLFHSDVVGKWAPYFEKNTPGLNHRLGVPVLIQFGDADEVIPPETMQHFAERLRESGEDITLLTYPEQTHTGVLEPSLPDAIAWMASKTE